MSPAPTSLPDRLNALLATAAFAVLAAQLVIVPATVASFIPFALVNIAAVILTPFHTVLMHEAVHGNLLQRKTHNEAAARALAIAFAVSFQVLRLGHLLHHRYSRHALDRPDIFKPGAQPWRVRAAYYVRLLGGMYAAEVAAFLLAVLPCRLVHAVVAHALPGSDESSGAIRRALFGMLDAPARRSQIRVDAAASLLLYALAFSLYGSYWPILLVAIIGRGVIVSLLDNVAHYGTSPVIGAPARDLALPAFAQRLFLNQNLHETHHRHSGLRWTELASAWRASGGALDGSYARVVLRQFRGPIATWPEAESGEPNNAQPVRQP